MYDGSFIPRKIRDGSFISRQFLPFKFVSLTICVQIFTRPEKEDLNEISNPAFLTQANVNGLSSSPELPHIGNTPLVSSPVG